MKFSNRSGVVQVLLRFVVMSLMCLGLVVTAQSPAPAMTGYHVVRARNPIHVYADPNPASAIVGTIAPGSELDINCQGTGVAAAGTHIWNQLVNGGWMTNYYASTESIIGFSPYLARCPGSSPNREFRALSRAASMIGQVYQSNGLTWSGWCDRFVALLFGQGSSGYANANANWSALKAMGMAHVGDTNPPFGALVFFNIGSDGHVAFALGDGTVISTPPTAGQAIFRVALSYFGMSRYRGWSRAQPSWNT